MRYVKPDLRSLANGPTGYCFAGESATQDFECGNGPQVYMSCGNGDNALNDESSSCRSGTYAASTSVWSGSPGCKAGMNPGQICGVGNSPES